MNHAVIFDMDGVILDSAPFHYESWKLLADENGLTADEGFFRETFGRTNRYIIPHFFGREMDVSEIDRHADRKEELYRELIAGRVQPLPGLRRLIDGLVARDVRLAVGSSAPAVNVEFILDELELRDAIGAYSSAEDVTHGKPDPEVFLKAAAKLGIDPGRCVVVEDAVHGVEAAHRAGMRCIAITTTNPRDKLSAAELVIDDYETLDADRVAELLA